MITKHSARMRELIIIRLDGSFGQMGLKFLLLVLRCKYGIRADSNCQSPQIACLVSVLQRR